LPKSAVPPIPQCTSGLVAPFNLAPASFDLPHPAGESQVDPIAAQLVAGYGSDALPLARRWADAIFKLGDTIKFADWCFVILALEELERQGNVAKNLPT
jgi:hypothetical protein